MQSVRITAPLLLGCMLLACGCNSEMKDLKIQNRTQQERISELESQVKTIDLQLAQCRRQLDSAGTQTGIEADALSQKIAALEEDLERKKALIATMQQQLLQGGMPLPAELNSMLEDFARDQEMVGYDPSRGVVKFKSDLLFEPGSDRVASDATSAVQRLCEILNSSQAMDFDIVVAGHTDDMPIAKPQTREAHPTNWHLSAHRAIAVLNIMTANKIASDRVSIRGFGQFRPASPNKPGNKGNPLNRRVEIYIVARGV